MKKRLLTLIAAIMLVMTTMMANDFMSNEIAYNITGGNTVNVANSELGSGNVTIPSTVTNGDKTSIISNADDAFQHSINKKELTINNRTKKTITGSQGAVEAYAWLSNDGKTLTFCYDNKRNDRVGTTFDLNTDDSYPGWNTDPWSNPCEAISSVVFDPSFAQARPTSTYFWFAKFSNLNEIIGLRYLNTSNVTSMWGMFYYCSSLMSLDLSNFDTSNVTSMRLMFCGCSSLSSLDMNNFNTENVIDMGFMFSDCSGLTSLDMSNFNTENVTNMYSMFSGCSGLTSLDMSDFNTMNVTDMLYMFYGCSALTSLDLGYFNTSNVTSMYGMFYGCSALTSLDLSNFNTSNVTNMSNMFGLCSSLTSLNLSGFNTKNVTNMGYMFWGCNSLTSLNLSNFNTENATNMNRMFNGCSALTSLDLSNFNTKNVTDMLNMFYGCSALTSLDVSNFDMSNVTESDLMFNHCESLNRLSVSLTMGNISDNACDGVGSTSAPCSIYAPDGFDYGVDTSGDYFVWKSGYFKLWDKSEAYAWLSSDSTTLTFCYDNVRYERDGMTYGLRMNEEYEYWLPGWQEIFVGKECNVSTVVINPSFADARPFYTSYWFQNMPRLESITGLEYLNTSEVKSMYNMFSECSSLTTIDLSHFETSKVKNMSEMFDGCTGLKRLDLSHFKTDSLERMNFMFGDCSNLESIVFGSINTSNLKECHYMFWNCSSLKRLDLRSFDFSNVTSSTWMLTNCVGLESLVIPYSMEIINDNACSGIGSDGTPCTISAPAGFDFGVDTSGDYFIWKRGRFKLGSGVLGDLDGNGRVSIDDLTTLIGYLLSGDATGLDLANADCYQDGRISIDDVTALINYLLSGSW